MASSLADVACGCAASSVMPVDREMLTVELKARFLNPRGPIASLSSDESSRQVEH